MAGKSLHNELPHNELTLQLNGRVTIDEFAGFVSSSKNLVQALTKSVIKEHKRKADRVLWHPSSESVKGSITVRYEAETKNPDDFTQIEKAFFEVGDALGHGRSVRFQEAEKPAKKLRDLIEKKGSVVESLVFMSQDKEALVKPEAERSHRAPIVSAYDEIQGQIETISSRNGLRFVLYDSLFDRAVTCYVGDARDDLDLAQFFGHKVRVMGLVTRDPETDRPFKMRDIRQVTLVEPPKYSWQDAEGILEFSDTSPEQFIRSLRDA